MNGNFDLSENIHLAICITMLQFKDNTLSKDSIIL